MFQLHTMDPVEQLGVYGALSIQDAASRDRAAFLEEGSRCALPSMTDVASVACDGHIPYCPRVSKFGTWVFGTGGFVLGLATYFCLQQLKHYHSDDDDGGMENMTFSPRG